MLTYRLYWGRSKMHIMHNLQYRWYHNELADDIRVVNTGMRGVAVGNHAIFGTTDHGKNNVSVATHCNNSGYC